MICDLNQIIDIWSNEIKWSEENLYNHTFKWKSQYMVSEYLDLVCGGYAPILPLYWGKPSYVKNFNYIWSEKTLWYYNVYLKSKNLDNTLENKINFIINYDLKKNSLF